MPYSEPILRAHSLALLHDIQGWVISEHLRQLEASLKRYTNLVERFFSGLMCQTNVKVPV